MGSLKMNCFRSEILLINEMKSAIAFHISLLYIPSRNILILIDNAFIEFLFLHNFEVYGQNCPC